MRWRRATELCLDARQQLDHLERFGDVAVCAELEAPTLSTTWLWRSA
jgi:hypothetical protein